MGVDSCMSVKELKDLIAKAGLSTTGCVEKSDLVVRAKEAEERLLQASVNSSSSSSCGSSSAGGVGGGGKRVINLGGYECVTYNLNPTYGAQCLVMVLHGFGATSGDFEPLATQLALQHKVAFVFPQAPASLATMGATAWWELDVMKWMSSAQAGEAGLAALIRDKPPGLDQCRKQLTTLLKAAFSKLGEDSMSLPLVLGGFSQGAMTAMDLALELGKGSEFNVDHVMMLSGAPIVVDEWAQRLGDKKDKHVASAESKKTMQVLLTHGRTDAVLPFVASTWTNDLLTKHGVDVEYKPHGGGHELGGAVILDAVRQFIDCACASKNK